MNIKCKEKPLRCSIKYDIDPGNTHVSQIVAGYKMLEKQGILKIESAQPCRTFRSSGNYEHNSIVEVEIDGKTIAYDMADDTRAYTGSTYGIKNLKGLTGISKGAVIPDVIRG